ncbi:caspase family protein [Sphaerochaeta sp. S2]|uniref:caspase family protein n=1 Tax=Sphaerochaeta sp. S2 TaxID=2798868 RepID=UPI0018E918C4|nr:caspase family protein [Sphaerochaeta sp. S2]MBJ2355558.1 caspase family protein [Sphaerochaeta sp. S2]
MRRVLLLLSILLLLMASCELYYEEPVQRGTVRIVSIGITYENEPEEVAYPEDEEKDQLGDLPGTVFDARELSKALSQQAQRAGWDSADIEVTLLLQEGTDHTQDTFDDPEYASRDRLEKTLNEIKDSATVDDLTIITYSGHGIEETGELLMAHTQTTGTVDISEDSPIVVTPTWLHDLIRPIEGKKLLIVDSCYSGVFVPESPSSLSWLYDKGIDDWYGKYFSDEEYEIPSFMVLTASADSDSYEIKFDDHNHGVFTSALLAALGWNHTTEEIANGVPPAAQNEMLTIDSIYKYIKKNQTYPVRWSLFSIGENVQHPMITGGAMDMLLFRY